MFIISPPHDRGTGESKDRWEEDVGGRGSCGYTKKVGRGFRGNLNRTTAWRKGDATYVDSGLRPERVQYSAPAHTRERLGATFPLWETNVEAGARCPGPKQNKYPSAAGHQLSSGPVAQRLAAPSHNPPNALPALSLFLSRCLLHCPSPFALLSPAHSPSPLATSLRRLPFALTFRCTSSSVSRPCPWSCHFLSRALPFPLVRLALLLLGPLFCTILVCQIWSVVSCFAVPCACVALRVASLGNAGAGSVTWVACRGRGESGPESEKD